MIIFCPQTNSEFRKDRKVQPRNPNLGTVFTPQILKTRYFTLTHLGWQSSLYVSLGSFQGADSQTSMGDHFLATTFHIHFTYGGGGDVPVNILLLYLWWSLPLLQFRIPIFTSFVAISSGLFRLLEFYLYEASLNNPTRAHTCNSQVKSPVPSPKWQSQHSNHLFLVFVKIPDCWSFIGICSWQRLKQMCCIAVKYTGQWR